MEVALLAAVLVDDDESEPDDDELELLSELDEVEEVSVLVDDPLAMVDDVPPRVSVL